VSTNLRFVGCDRSISRLRAMSAMGRTAGGMSAFGDGRYLDQTQRSGGLSSEMSMYLALAPAPFRTGPLFEDRLALFPEGGEGLDVFRLV
jgi:hypothetical protein